MNGNRNHENKLKALKIANMNQFPDLWFMVRGRLKRGGGGGGHVPLLGSACVELHDHAITHITCASEWHTSSLTFLLAGFLLLRGVATCFRKALGLPWKVSVKCVPKKWPLIKFLHCSVGVNVQ